MSRSSDDFRFDVYVSHVDADRQWVEEELTPRLEAAGRRVCLDHDLAPGGIQIEERSRAIADSRKTLLVLSRQYMDTDWVLFDEAVARELDPAARKRRLIPLLRDDCDVPLRVRPLVAVDLRRGDDPRPWERLLAAVDPSRREERRPSLAQRVSLGVLEATRELERPGWNGTGATVLAALYAVFVAAVLLLSLLLRDLTFLPPVLTALLLAPAGSLLMLARQEDPDLFRRLSHVAAGSRLCRAAPVLLAVLTAAGWWWLGVPELGRVLCGPWGCPQAGKIHLALGEFTTVGLGGEDDWSRILRTGLEQQLATVPELRVLGQGLPQIDDAARRRLKVDYTLKGEVQGGAVPALAVALYDRRSMPMPPAVTVEGSRGDFSLATADGRGRRLALQQELAGALLERLGLDVPEALRRRLATIPTDQPRALELNDEGFRLLRQERWAEAEGKLRAALALDDDFAIAWSNLAEVAWRTGRLDEALTHRRAAVDRLPTYAPLHYNLGHLLAALGRNEEALGALERAVSLDRAHAPSFNEMGNVLLALGRAEGAVRALREAIALEPGFAPASKNLGRAFLAAGETADAVPALERALTLYPPSDWLGRLEARCLLVDANARLGAEAEACRHLAEVRRLDPDGIGPWTPAALATGTFCTQPTRETPHA